MVQTTRAISASHVRLVYPSAECSVLVQHGAARSLQTFAQNISLSAMLPLGLFPGRRSIRQALMTALSVSGTAYYTTIGHPRVINTLGCYPRMHEACTHLYVTATAPHWL
jgi:hypothetical protein